ncbi:MAG: S8 family serine peptidase [Bacteroidota bacterium]
MNRLLLMLAACFIFMQSDAQNNRLLLQSGTMLPGNNVSQFIADDSPVQQEIFNGYYYRIIQFNSIPTSAEKEVMAHTGLVLMNYFPDKAFVTAIPVLFDKSKLLQFNVAAVVKQDAVQKMNRSLLGDAPSYAKRVNGFVDVMVQYYQNIEYTVALQTFSSYEKISENRTVHTVTLRIPENELRIVAEMSCVFYMSPAGVPSFADDTKGRSLHRSNVINSDYASGRHYDGSGIVIGLADDGETGPHIDFTGRLTNHIVGVGGPHGDMCSGICVGAGNLDPTIKGMATGAYLHVYDIVGYLHLINAVSNYDSLGTVLLSTSYSQGCNEYTIETQLGDQLIHDNPQLGFVFSAGNSGLGNNNDCILNPYGAAGGTWGNITGGYKEGKNVIAVGDLNALDVIEATSSRGPASDGRIKPDICANGVGQLSTDQDNTYQVGGGTSAACPGIAGICAQLNQAYKSLNGGAEPESPLIKACLLNTAEDLGNEGPDYIYGWGRVNAYRALTTIEDGRYIKDSISQGQSNTHVIAVPPGVSDFRVMIYWNDPEGTAGAAKALVNDINIHLTDPINFSWNPWVLDPTANAVNLATPAIKGIDSLNNMEQVSVAAGFQGNWTVHVDGFNIPNGPQTYYIVYEFRTEEIQVTYPQGGEGFVPGETEVVRWDAVKGLGNYTLEYSVDAGTNWTLIDNNVNQNNLYFNWAVPATITGQALLRVSRGGFTGVSDSTFAIIGTATNLTVDYACVDSIHLVWDSVPGAVDYNIYQLGSSQMDVVGTSSTNSFVVTGTNPNGDYWFSVSANTAFGTTGRRAYAIHKPAGVFNCPLSEDAGLTSVISPAAGVFTDCQGNDSLTVSVLIGNPGINDIFNMTVSYNLNGGAVVTDTITDTIPSGGSLIHNFNVPVNYSSAGSYLITSWITFTGDLNIYNDTATSSTTVIPGTLASLPFTDNFDSYTLCSTITDCELTVCPLGNGWLNDENLAIDDIDFRVSAGPTPSTNTGPSNDHTTGSITGQYVYLEASACFNKRAQLLTPCIDLTTSAGPQLRFWYHMSGANMGELHIDVLTHGTWTDDVMTPISGDQGNAWQQATVNLAAFAGDIVTIRFRGITGGGATSDMAIDDINILETNVPPVPLFAANFTAVCSGSTVTFTDMSEFTPSTWQWNITPSTFTFTGGTTAASQNPQVQFNGTGTYTVQLIATNSFGTDSLSMNAYISVVTPASLAFVQDFQGTWVPSGWRIETAGNPITWEIATNITGRNGLPTNAAKMNNFDYQPIGGQDGLARLEVDLGTAVSPKMTFDVAYARAGGFANDGLRIDISTDCGATFTPSGYFKQGNGLATSAPTNQPFTPQAAGQWRNDTLNLTPWAGQTVSIKFVNISASGNNLYIDNVNIDNITGINETALNAAINIFPNPATGGLFNITIDGLINTDAEFTVTDVQGKLIEKRSVTIGSAYTGSFDLSQKDKGIYILEIRTASGVSRYRLSVI